MVATERSRSELYERLDDTLGTDAADTLMGYLPPVGWADVATKTDLKHLELRLESRIDRLDARINGLDASIDGRIHQLESRIERALRQTVLALVGAMVASVGAAVGITQAIS